MKAARSARSCRMSSPRDGEGGRRDRRKAGINPGRATAKINLAEAERLHKAMNETKLMAPPTNCIVRSVRGSSCGPCSRS